ncbi:MAG: ABC transporter permease [Actinomycetota bacterium]
MASFGLLLLWQLRRYRSSLLVVVLIQVALGLGIVYGLSFLLPEIDPASALFLSTGAPTIALLLLGLTMVPQEVAQDKLTGAHDYVATLPVPRLAWFGAQMTFWLAVQLPGTVLALVAASARFGFELGLNGYVLPAFLLVALTGAAVGFAMASVLKPEVTGTATSFISVGLLLFSPIDFPMSRLPVFLQVIHTVLPVKYMADLVRWSLTGRYVDAPGVAFAVVGAWCAVCLAISYRVATRRR